MSLPFPFPADPLTCALAALALLAAAALFAGNRKPWLSRIRRKPFLTPNEAEFFLACNAPCPPITFFRKYPLPRCHR